jgi:hypothetical protein
VTEAAEALRMLVEHPMTSPEPVAELRRRVDARRRRRHARRVAVATLAVAAISIVMVPLVGRSGERPTRIATGPDATRAPDATTIVPTGGLVFVAGVPVDTRLEYTVPNGWQTLFSDGHRLIVATRPLSDRDQALALLARADASFTALVPDAVIVVVGGDRLEAKYGTGRDGRPLDPGPPYALGPERELPGGVRFRQGDAPQSILRIASYAGPAAPAIRLREAESVAAGIRQVRIGDPSVAPTPPPAGSTTGLPGGPLSAAESGMPEVARGGFGPSSVVVLAESDCAYMRSTASVPQRDGALAGGCATRPTVSDIAVVGLAAELFAVPGVEESTAVILRVAPAAVTVAARTADGRTFPAVLGADGWGVAVGPGRIVGLSAQDGAGRPLSEVFVE